MNGSDRSLVQMGVVLDGSGWPHGDEVVRDVLARCHQSEALQVIDELIEHVRTMGIAPRFRADRFADQLASNEVSDPPRTHLDYVRGGGQKLSEVGHKRECLLVELTRIRDALMQNFGELASLRLNIEATNMEADGTPVPKPSLEELRRRDVLQREEPPAGQ